MKKLVVFYSLEGNTKFISEVIAEEFQADILELKPVKEIAKKGLGRYFKAGKQIFRKEIPELNPVEKNPEDYDIIIIGGPVWMGTFTPPLAAFFKKFNIKGKKIALFCCHGGGPGKVFENLKAQLKDNEIIGQCDFLEPLKKDKENAAQKAKDWIKSLFK